MLARLLRGDRQWYELHGSAPDGGRHRLLGRVRTCSVDIGGSIYHRSAGRVIPGGRVPAFAGYLLAGDLERRIYTVQTGGLDVEKTTQGIRSVTAALAAFVEEVGGHRQT